MIGCWNFRSSLASLRLWAACPFSTVSEKHDFCRVRSSPHARGGLRSSEIMDVSVWHERYLVLERVRDENGVDHDRMFVPDEEIKPSIQNVKTRPPFTQRYSHSLASPFRRQVRP
ncbi:hypothetical protein ASPFODRAFT_35378 [Aspergillus luchuensis CBS 106.47]|uniref:Uncharacterized protein n=1 Tax=Aspergillus luchuensis (strain CBS 106.47) TaxID=1137211 RepID=A0A1M3TAZ0_ASPLC|nr:hypothetical protein ASPFODRAFT_35378 [Aspergillus luchuensis CBS 106.47]